MPRLWFVMAIIAVAAIPATSQVSGRSAPESVETHAPVRIDGSVLKARLEFQPKPEYPPDAVKAGVQGTVRLRAVVARNGSVKKLKVATGNPLLAKAAVEAVSRWRYRPILVGGKPHEFRTESYVIFKLPKKSRVKKQSASPAASSPRAEHTQRFRG